MCVGFGLGWSIKNAKPIEVKLFDTSTLPKFEYKIELISGVIVMDENTYTSDKRVLVKATPRLFDHVRATLPCSNCGNVDYDAVNWEDSGCSKCKPDEICLGCGSINNFNKLGVCQSNECKLTRTAANSGD